MTGFVSITVTASNRDEARAIARALVDEKLAACVNITPNVTSIYRWQGAIEEAEEVLLLIKTRSALFDAVAARVKALHSYDCPCIVAEPLVAGDAAYLQWIDAETLRNP